MKITFDFIAKVGLTKPFLLHVVLKYIKTKEQPEKIIESVQAVQLDENGDFMEIKVTLSQNMDEIVVDNRNYDDGNEVWTSLPKRLLFLLTVMCVY